MADRKGDREDVSERLRGERWLALALAVDAALALADVAEGPIAGTYVLTPLLLAVVTGPRLTAVGGAVATALAVLSGAWNDNFGDDSFFIRLAIVVAGSVLACWAAHRRRRSDASQRELEAQAAVSDVVEASPAGVIGIDERGVVTLFNPSAERMFGFGAGDAVGRELAELVVPPRLRDAHRRGLERYLATGETHILGRTVELPAVRADGSELPVALTIVRLPGAGSAAFAGYARDLTESKRAELGQRLLAQTADLLASSLDYEQTLRDIAALAVPEFADWCGVDVPRVDGLPESVAIAHVDPEKIALATDLRRRYPPTDDDALTHVIAGADSFLQADVADEALVAYARDDEHLALLRAVGFCSVLVVPLRAGRRTVGAMTFVAAESGRRFDRGDVELAEELARRAGTALENARLSRERAEVTHTLLASLRPPEVPRLPRWDTATLYQPAERTSEVGGDFYDVFDVAGGWMLVIGDVVGKGPSAAALTSLARWSLRAAATLTASPRAALAHLNDDLHREGQAGLLSAVCVLLRDSEQGAQATVASAGHPLPVLVSRGEPALVGRTSLLLGVAPHATFTETTIAVGEGDALVLYTDGVLDTTGPHDRFGEDRLLEALRGGAGSAAELLVGLSQPLAAFQHGPQRDDIAVLVVQRSSRPEHLGEPHPRRAAPARRRRGSKV